MDKWTDGQMDRWTDKQIDRQTNQYYWALRIMTFSITTQCHQAECRYAKYHGAFYWSLPLNFDQIDRLGDGRTDRYMDEQRDRCMDEQSEKSIIRKKQNIKALDNCKDNYGRNPLHKQLFRYKGSKFTSVKKIIVFFNS